MAGPVVDWMKKSRLVALAVRPFGRGMAQELAHLWKPEKYRGSVIGKVVLALGMPLCRYKYKKSDSFFISRGTI
jgi:hypothetical protein